MSIRRTRVSAPSPEPTLPTDLSFGAGIAPPQRQIGGQSRMAAAVSRRRASARHRLLGPRLVGVRTGGLQELPGLVAQLLRVLVSVRRDRVLDRRTYDLFFFADDRERAVLLTRPTTAVSQHSCHADHLLRTVTISRSPYQPQEAIGTRFAGPLLGGRVLAGRLQHRLHLGTVEVLLGDVRGAGVRRLRLRARTERLDRGVHPGGRARLDSDPLEVVRDRAVGWPVASARDGRAVRRGRALVRDRDSPRRSDRLPGRAPGAPSRCGGVVRHEARRTRQAGRRATPHRRRWARSGPTAASRAPCRRRSRRRRRAPRPHAGPGRPRRPRRPGRIAW